MASSLAIHGLLYEGVQGSFFLGGGVAFALECPIVWGLVMRNALLSLEALCADALQKKTKKGLQRSIDVVRSPVIIMDASEGDWLIKHANESMEAVAGANPPLPRGPLWGCWLQL